MPKVIIDGVEYIPMPEPVHTEGLLGALEVRFDSDAGENITVRDYLRILLLTLWDEGEGFSGKRPFGNSGWEYELYDALMEAGYVQYREYQPGGGLHPDDKRAAHAYVAQLIKAAFHGGADA